MLKTTNQAAVLGVFLMFLTALASADPTSNARKAITAIYQQQATAAEHKDLDGAFTHLSPDYVSIDLKGHKTGIAGERQSLQSLLSIANEIHNTVSITQFSFKKNGALAIVKENVTVSLVDPRTQKKHSVMLVGVSKDTWIKAKSGWLQKRSQEISETSTLDGKPFSPQSSMPFENS